MIPEIDESLLTAYALNELSAEDRSKVESHLAENPGAMQTIADIQATAAILTTELGRELQFTPLLPISPVPHRRRRATAAIGLAAAAAIAAGVGLYVHAINKPVQQTALVSQASKETNHQIAAVQSRRGAPIAAVPDDFGSNVLASTQHDNVFTGQVTNSSGFQMTRGGATTGTPFDSQDSILLPQATDSSGSDARAGIRASKAQAEHSARFTADRDQVIAGMIQDTRNYCDEGKYNEALATIDNIQRLDPSNAYAGEIRQMLEDKASSMTTREFTQKYDVESTRLLNDAKEKVIPYEDYTRYAPDWPSIAGNTHDSQLPPQLDRRLPELRFNANSLSDVIDFMRDVTGTNISMDWPALEKAGIAKDAPVTLNLRDIKFQDALSLILKNACTGQAKAGYKIENGTITISVGPDFRLDNPIVQGESYSHISDNPFLSSRRSPLSTFAVDVDTASYSNVRRFIEQGQLPPADAVRIEEMVNYFPYSTSGPRPTDADPVAVNVELADCPWQPAHRLARIALKAKSLADQKRPPSNLVFLLDVSGSMADENKLPLLKQAIKKLVNRLTPTDRVSIVTYAGKAQMTLESTVCNDESDGRSKSGRQKILDAIDRLNADGETNGGDGIQLAYKTAVAGFLKEGVNRVILATDGDFNVGIVDPTQLTSLIEKEATTGVYLTVLGVGMGNVKDSTMESLANHGKGNYAYLDSVDEADKVLGRQINATLVTVARDVKLQIEFNPATVAGYRLIGYENRAMPNRDFNNDQMTAGEMGAGHSVTALYELIPAAHAAAVQALKYQPAPPPSTNPADYELMTVSLRYQPPQGGESRKVELPVVDQPEASANASSDLRFAAAVASFGMILRNSPYRGEATFDQVIAEATAARGEDVGGFRSQFIDLTKRAKALSRN